MFGELLFFYYFPKIGISYNVKKSSPVRGGLYCLYAAISGISPTKL